MQTSTTLRHFSPSVIALALVITLTAAILLVIGVQNLAPFAEPMRAPNASAEQDLRMVMQELERERLDQLNASSFAQALRARNTAEQDLRMVMQEQERERLDQLNANASFVAMRATNTAEQDLRMVMQELERERLDQLSANLPPSQLGVVRTIDQSSITCLEPRPSCDR